VGAGQALTTFVNKGRLEFGLFHIPMVHREACQCASQLLDLCVCVCVCVLYQLQLKFNCVCVCVFFFLVCSFLFVLSPFLFLLSSVCATYPHSTHRFAGGAPPLPARLLDTKTAGVIPILTGTTACHHHRTVVTQSTTAIYLQPQ
jgi:hypothetical protein